MWCRVNEIHEIIELVDGEPFEMFHEDTAKLFIECPHHARMGDAIVDGAYYQRPYGAAEFDPGKRDWVMDYETAAALEKQAKIQEAIELLPELLDAVEAAVEQEETEEAAKSKSKTKSSKAANLLFSKSFKVLVDKRRKKREEKRSADITGDVENAD